MSVSTDNETLILEEATGKVNGHHIRRENNRFVGWLNTETEIFWDIRFPNSGEVFVDIAYSNVKCIAKTKMQVILENNTGTQTIEECTNYSGGWENVKITRMGKVTVERSGKFRLIFRPLEINGGQACDFFHATLSGPGAIGAKVIDIFAPNADSVHLWFPTENALMFYNEMIVDESFKASYFMACGFQNGYFGIQEIKPDEKVALFSLWDVKDQEDINNKEGVTDDDLASIVRKGENVKVQRFGGEGTGFQSIYPFVWEIGEIHRFLVTAQRQGRFTIFTAYIYSPTQKQWKLMSSLKRLAEPKTLTGYYCFLEEWIGNWGHIERQASFNPWYRNESGEWLQINEATFTRTGKNSNVNGWVQDDWFYLRTGGKTTNVIKANHKIKREVSDQIPTVLNDIDKIIIEELFIP